MCCDFVRNFALDEGAGTQGPRLLQKGRWFLDRIAVIVEKWDKKMPASFHSLTDR